MSGHECLPDADRKVPGAGDVAKERVCMRCSTAFQSAGFGERICKKCKGSSVWRSSAAGPRGGGSRRR